MNTEDGKTAFAKVKAIQPIIEGMLKNAEQESEHFKTFRHDTISNFMTYNEMKAYLMGMQELIRINNLNK